MIKQASQATFFQGLKVVTAQEMQRVEKRAFEENVSEENLIVQAGNAVSFFVQKWFTTIEEQEQRKRKKNVLLITGKGNNGADAYVAGIFLLEQKYSVKAFHIGSLEESSKFCKIQMEKFKKAGGFVQQITSSEQMFFSEIDLIVDGLFGTGFQGDLESFYQEVIEKINHTYLPVISIDIPSGVDGNTGEVKTVAIQAFATIALELPKVGFFLNQGWQYVGRVITAKIGLPQKYIDEAKEEFFLPEERNFLFCLPPIQRTRHKYMSGVVYGLAGSKGMEGSAKLAASAALRMGAGMVKMFISEEMRIGMANAPYEVIFFIDKSAKEIVEESEKKANTLLIGPGLGREEKTFSLLKEVLSKSRKIPLVLDADALFFLAKNPNIFLHDQVIFTPHKREMERFFQEENTPNDLAWIKKCQKFCDEKKGVLIVKGAPSFVFVPHQKPFVIARGDPGMATAGSGDVLTGILASLLAQKCSCLEAALLGSFIHGLSGEIAAGEKTSYSLIASDLIEYLSRALHVALRGGGILYTK